MKKIFVFLFLALTLGVEAQNYWVVDTTVASTSRVSDSVFLIPDSSQKIEVVKEKMSNNFRPELMAISGAGYNNQKKTMENFGFVETRLMFKLFTPLRVGPYLGYTQYGLEKESYSALLGREFKYGVSFDSYAFLTHSLSHYFWLNTGIKQVTDNYEEKYFASKTKTKLFFISTGLSLSSEVRYWFSHNQIILDYQRPIESSVSASWKGKTVESKAFDKESFRLTLESGVKRFYVNNKLNFEPIIHLGYGKSFGSSSYYYEYGGGIGFGYFKDWYRDIIKIKVFYRDREIGADRLNSEIVVNLGNFVRIFYFKKQKS